MTDSRVGEKMISYGVLFPTLIILFFCQSACAPIYHDYNNISELEDEMDEGKDIQLLDVEKAHGGEFLYRIDYLLDGHHYILESRTFDSNTGKFAQPKDWYTFLFYYEDRELKGAIELLDEESSELFLINECFTFIPSPNNCLLNFNNVIQSELYSSHFLHESDRLKPLLRGEKLSSDQIYEKEEDLKEDEPSKWNLLWQVPLMAFLHTPGVIILLPPMVIMEHNRKSSWNDIDEKVTISVGDSYREILTLVEKIPIESKYFDGNTGLAYFKEAISGDAVFAFGLQDGTVAWTRKCVFNAPEWACPPPTIPSVTVSNQKASNND